MSDEILLSEEQKQAVTSDNPRLTIVAAAGAGKTRVLSERYVRHVVQEALTPDELLTITFTKKAAADMKRRIVDRLRAMGLTGPAQVAETGPIQTIHSFCERILRENSLEAGLDPQFEILAESRASRLVMACIREALSMPLTEQPNAEALLTYLAGKRQAFGENKSPYGVLEAAISRVLHELRGSGHSPQELEERHAHPRTLRAHWESVFLGIVKPEVEAAFQNVEGGSFGDRLQAAIKASGGRAPAWLKGKGDPEAEEDALVHTCGLVQLALSAWWRLEREMEAHQALDFAALEERAVRLLKNSPCTRERLRDQYRVVMIDESQDLNPIQYELLDLLQPERLMLVGDAQQSIYAFRQADVRLFNHHIARHEPLWLTRNYRSKNGILNFVDYVFGSLWGAGYRAMAQPQEIDLDQTNERDFAGVEVWRQAANDMNAVAAYVGELLEEGVQYKEITVLVRDMRGAQAVEAAFKQAKIPHRIAGGTDRFYTRLEVRDLANALRAVADPYDDFSLLAFLRSPAVGLSLDSVFLLGRTRPVVEALNDFVPPVPEDVEKLARFRRWYDPLRQVADRLSAWEVLADLFARSPLLTELARRPDAEALLANVRKLLSLATKEPELGPLEYAERIREIQDLRHREGDAPADDSDAQLVTIMTVHKSKGLEFEVVILPQTDKKLVSNARDVAVEARAGLVATKFGKTACLMHRYLSEEQKRRDEEEEMRVLYVALTRAKQRLCVCLFPPKRDRTVSKLLVDILGDTPPSGIRVRDAHNSPVED